MINFTDADVEAMARAMIENGGGIPDLMVIPGEPQVFGTPKGPVFNAGAVPPVPMWTLYTGSARKALELAYIVLQRKEAA